MKIYKEEQSYRNIYGIGLLLFFTLVSSFILLRELFWDSSVDWTALVFSALMLLTFCVLIRLLIQFKLKTAISTKNISVKMSPLQIKKQKIKLKDIESYQIITASSMAQWHGSNLSFGHEQFYSFTGRNGVLINTKDGQQYFIGSRKIDEMAHALNKVLG